MAAKWPQHGGAGAFLGGSGTAPLSGKDPISADSLGGVEQPGLGRKGFSGHGSFCCTRAVTIPSADSSFAGSMLPQLRRLSSCQASCSGYVRCLSGGKLLLGHANLLLSATRPLRLRPDKPLRLARYRPIPGRPLPEASPPRMDLRCGWIHGEVALLHALAARPLQSGGYHLTGFHSPLSARSPRLAPVDSGSTIGCTTCAAAGAGAFHGVFPPAAGQALNPPAADQSLSA